jgi:hypothetical protein
MVDVREHGDEEVAWTDPESNRGLRVRRILKMNAVPEVRESATQATGDVEIGISEGAEFWSENERTWQEMGDEQFRRWIASNPGRDPLKYSTTASITKTIDDGSGEPVISSTSAFGIAGDSPHRDWSKSESGIAIKLNWKGDRLVVWWRSLVIGVDEAERIVDLPFSSRFKASRR